MVRCLLRVEVKLVIACGWKEACDRGEIRLIHKPRAGMHADVGRWQPPRTSPSPNSDSTMRRSAMDALLERSTASIGGLCQQRLCCLSIDAMAPEPHRERVSPLRCEPAGGSSPSGKFIQIKIQAVLICH